MPLLFAIYLMIWISSFVEEGLIDDDGHEFDDKHAKNIFSKIVLIVGIVTISLMPVIGWFVDKVEGHITIPLAFGSRAVVMLIFLYFVKEPENWGTYIVCTFMITFSFFERIAVEKMFQQSLPSEIRGTMIGVLHLFGQIGQIIFATIAAILVT